MSAVLEARSVSKVYHSGETEIRALHSVSVEICSGEFVALTGPSGCGKSTLLNILGLADLPTEGIVAIDGQLVDFGREPALVALRRTKLGYVFQQFNLLPTLTARENVMVPLLLSGVRASDAAKRADVMLDRVGLAARCTSYPARLSGGEMQRVAVARAAIHEPAILLADEPTGNLDSTSGASVLELLRSLASQGTAVVMATHSDTAISFSSRVIALLDGELQS